MCAARKKKKKKEKVRRHRCRGYSPSLSRIKIISSDEAGCAVREWLPRDQRWLGAHQAGRTGKKFHPPFFQGFELLPGAAALFSSQRTPRSFFFVCPAALTGNRERIFLLLRRPCNAHSSAFV